jgi:hypothetical protein
MTTAGLDKISAWAGVHYFASGGDRVANAQNYAVVTFPEGNGLAWDNVFYDSGHSATTNRIAVPAWLS